MDSDSPLCESPIDTHGNAFNSSKVRFAESGGSTILWDASTSNCPAAWHGDTLDGPTSPNKLIFLKPSRGTMSISATFKDVVLPNPESFLGCRISICMGRLDCSTAPYQLRLMASTSVPVSTQYPKANRQTPIVSGTGTSLLPMAENMYTLGLGRVDIPYNTKTDICISLDIIGGAAMQNPFAGLVLHWIKLDFEEMTPRVNATEDTLPSHRTITIEKQQQIADKIPITTRNAIRSTTINFPNRDDNFNFTTGPVTSQPPLSLGSRLQRRISIPVRQATIDSPRRAPSISTTQFPPPPTYEESVPAVKFLNLIRQPDRWKRAGLAILLSRLRDLFLARLVLRWVVLVGTYFLGSPMQWLTPLSLILFWLTDWLVFRRSQLGRFSCLGALWTLGFWPYYGVLMNSSVDLAAFMGFIWVGGWIDGRLLTSEEVAEFEQVMVLEEFWKDFFQNLFTPNTVRANGT